MDRAKKIRKPGAEGLIGSAVASRIIAAAADLSLVLDPEGTIVEVFVGVGIPANPTWQTLVGQKWVDTVAKDSVGKAEQLIADAREARTMRLREINQKVDRNEVPFRFSAVFLEEKYLLVLGRDLRIVAALQQQMVNAQQAMDQEVSRMRQADTRYRILFHVSSEGVLVVDTNRRVVESNPVVASMLGESAQALQGRSMFELFEAKSVPPLQGLIAAIEAGARPTEVKVYLKGQTEHEVTVSAALFRQSGAILLLVRIGSNVTESRLGGRSARMLAVLDAMPDGFVVTGEDRKILCANAAFCDFVQQASEKQVIGESLDRWLGRPNVDLNIMLANLREHGVVRNFSTIVRGDFGSPQEAIVTAVSALDGKIPSLGFTIRLASSKLSVVPNSTVMPRSVDQLRELVGRVPLKDLVRESADLIEKLCIEAALSVSGNNRASAAQLLGLSRQGLYSKLRRYGIAEFDA